MQLLRVHKYRDHSQIKDYMTLFQPIRLNIHTHVPDTQIPPTQAPPTQAPPTQAPPTQAPPTQAPPTQAPPTQAPPTQGAVLNQSAQQ